MAPPLQEYGGRRLTDTARSADGTPVRWVLVQNANHSRKGRPVGLIVTAYGAYGIPTLLDTTRWKPYLERGWCIGIALVRGGGDDNEAWAEAGRREGKLRGVEDLEACVRAMQRVSGVSPRATCLFGRSAGGYLVGAAVVRHPQGDLFGMVYTEVPYVDVLRTAGNPALPLTSFEYEEFGDPARKVADFEFLLRHAPVSGLGPGGAPGVWVLCRTASNDRQVYAYESAKWVQALRGSAKGEAGEEKLLSVTAGVGHFVKGLQRNIERAEDFLLLGKKVEDQNRK
jgi:oligopeptidase B